MKSSYLSGLLLAIFGAALVSLSFAYRDTGTSAHALRAKAMTGAVTGLSVESSGRVAFRLEGKTEDGASFALWFATPPSQSRSTLFEDLVLDVVMRTDRELTVVGEAGTDENGESVEDAITVESIRYG